MSRAVIIQLLPELWDLCSSLRLLSFSRGVGVNGTSSLFAALGGRPVCLSSPGCSDAAPVALVELWPNFGISLDDSVSACWTEQLVSLG